MADYLIHLPASDYARLYGEIRAHGSCCDQPIQAYSVMVTDDKTELRLRVVYVQSCVIREKGMPDLYGTEQSVTYVFDAARVEALQKGATI